MKKRITRSRKFTVLMMAIAGIFGGLTAIASYNTRISHPEIQTKLVDSLTNAYLFFQNNIFWFHLAINLIFIFLTIRNFLLLKKLNLDMMDEEEYYMKEDIRVNKVMLYNSIALIINFTLFCSVYASSIFEIHSVGHAYELFLFILTALWNIFIEVRIINYQKKHNPEKKGDPLSYSFDKDWMESCDEAERMMIYKASYKTFKIMKYTFMGAYIFLLVATLFFDIGFLPIFLVGFFWLMHTVSYCVSCIKNIGKNIQ